MRDLRGTDIVKVIGTTPVPITGPEPRRHAIIVSIPSGNRITISYRNDVTIDQGLTIKNQSNPFKVTRD